MENKEIDRLIIKLISNTISDTESEKLVVWLKDPLNLKYFNQFIKINQLINSSKAYDHRYSLQQFIKNTQNKNRYRKRIWYAAATIAIFICLGIYTTINIQNEIIESNWEQIIVKTKTNDPVKLITDKGEEVLLSHSKNQILNIDGKELEKIGDSIVYKSDPNHKKIKYNKIVVPKGKIYTIILADETALTINSDSEVRFPTSFTEKTRDIWVKGEVFLSVAHRKDKPFIVHTNNFDTKVLGTEFNIRSYKDEVNEIVTLVNGSVELLKDEKATLLTPGHQFTYSVNHGFDAAKINKVDTYLYTSWTNGTMYFDNQRLEDLISRLSKWYAFNYQFKNEKLKDSRYTGGVKKNDDLRKIFKMLNYVNDATFTVENNIIIIE